MRPSPHLFLCSRGMSKRHAPLPIIGIGKYLHGGGMLTRRHYTQLAQAIAQSLCGYHRRGPLWAAIYNTPPRNWDTIVLLLDGDPPVVDWGDLILVDYTDREGWGPTITSLVIRELALIADRNIPQ